MIRPAGILLAAALALAAAPPPAPAQQSAERELQESQRRLEQIRRERNKLRQEMERLRARVHDMSGELSNLQRQVGTSAALLGELDHQVLRREEEIHSTVRDILAAQDRLAERKALLNRRLRDIYKRGPLHSTEVLLTAPSFSDLLNRYKYLFLVARQDRALVREVAGLQAELTHRERALRRNLAELERAQLEKEREYETLSELETQQKRALTDTRARERSTARRVDQLARDERQLATLIATLERKRKEAERLAAAKRAPTTRNAPAAASTITTRDLGNLAWPVEGRLVYRFGRSTQPNGTTLRWNGIGIGAAAGAPVRAVEEGTVVMAGPFEGYGPTVVLSHGGGYYSLYLYLKETRVREGDTVKSGTVVGTVGGESTPEGAHLEFQIRAPGGVAVDPLAWLRQRRGS